MGDDDFSDMFETFETRWFYDMDNDTCEEEEYEGMYIKLHGGACCGVKHIHELGTDPHAMLTARDTLADDQTSFGRHGCDGVNDAHADTYPEDFFNEAAPKEKRTERLDRLIAFLKANRPHGIIEIVLINLQNQWFPLLEERGFKKVSEAVNSNTDRTLNVFHLCY